MRYTFPLIFKDKYVYAIGGRVYGSDEVSIINKCEKFDLISKQW